MAGELIAQFTDHEGRVSRFIEQFKNKADLEALTRIYLRQIQDLEDALFEIILERDLDNAIGVQLTTIGNIVQQPRTTSDDDEFRTAIRARIAINLSEATGEDMIKVAGLLLAVAGETFDLVDEYPAQQRITVYDALTISASLAHGLLDETDAGGVRLMFVYADSLDHADRFTASDTVGPTTGGGKGLASSTDPGDADGGGLASVIGG